MFPVGTNRLLYTISFYYSPPPFLPFTMCVLAKGVLSFARSKCNAHSPSIAPGVSPSHNQPSSHHNQPSPSHQPNSHSHSNLHQVPEPNLAILCSTPLPRDRPYHTSHISSQILVYTKPQWMHMCTKTTHAHIPYVYTHIHTLFLSLTH